MIIDCHVHISACTPSHGFMSDKLLNSLPFRFMRWRLGLVGNDESTERALEAKLAGVIGDSPLDAAVVLAFDGVHDRDGRFVKEKTHLYVTNDYVIELAKRHPSMLFGASVHPYRTDAIEELERGVKAGAVLLKWLPITQDFNPSDPRCIPFYEVLAHHGLPLLCHTGGEQSLPQLDKSTADPMLLVEALRRGVTVIGAHCGTRSTFREPDYLDSFVRLCHDHEHFYGDTSALNLPTRWHAYDAIARDPVVQSKLLHGSDWPIISLPRPRDVGWEQVWDLMTDGNWIRRDIRIKQKLGFDDAYWHRAAKVLRLAPVPASTERSIDSAPVRLPA